ncbi:TIGR02678 family protein [Actinokineospora sp. 24-640]
MTSFSTPDELAAQRRTALRALLARPLLVAGRDDDAIRLVRRHERDLRDWLSQETGWRLRVDSEAVRLFKTSTTHDDSTHPARDGRGRPAFGRRRYVLLCLALSVLERADAQITLGRLAEGVLAAVAEPELADAGIEFTLGRRDERSDLVAVVRLLMGWGVLDRVAGEEDAYLSATGDVLYDVRRRVLSTLLTGHRGPSTVAAPDFDGRLSELTDEPTPDTDELRNRALRQRLTRRLLDDPVVYYDELTEDERAYLVSQRHAITRRIADATGLVTEMRAEGVAMVDPDDDLTDVRMPEQRTDGHLTLLIAEHLAAAAAPVPVQRLLALVRDLTTQHASFWRKGVTEPGAETELLDGALGRLRALRLVTDLPGPMIAPRPAIARYAVEAPTIREQRRAR